MALIKRSNDNYLSSWLSDFFDNDSMLSGFSGGRNSIPAVNVKETEKEFKLEVAAPGIPKENIHVHVDNNMLTIEGEAKFENEEKEKGQYTRREFGSTSFQRSFTLPENVDPENIKAKCDNGIVNIMLPKREEARKLNRKEIKIS